MDEQFDERTGYAIIAAMAPRPAASVSAGTRLRDDLMFDSMRLIELAMAMERHFDIAPLDLGDAVGITTAGDVLDMVRQQRATGRLA